MEEAQGQGHAQGFLGLLPVGVEIGLGRGEIAAEERARLRAALTAYCRLDTWGMVKLHERLQGLAAGGSSLT